MGLLFSCNIKQTKNTLLPDPLNGDAAAMYLHRYLAIQGYMFIFYFPGLGEGGLRTLSAWGLGIFACCPSEGPTWPYNPDSDSCLTRE